MSGQQQKRILVIDDEPDVSLTLRAVLEENGFNTDSYTDPALAYENFREGLYDLVILDVKMPVADGFLLYQKIKMTDNRVKICFLTAGEYYYERFREEHGFGVFKQEFFLKKPIGTEDLVRKIKRLLESG